MPDWSNQAGCLSEDPDLFFPTSEGTRALAQIAEATAICATCPVTAKCLSFALYNNIEYGIWAGTTPYERTLLRLPKDERRGRRQIVGSRRQVRGPSTSVSRSRALS